MYFTDPAQLLEVFSQLEGRSMFMIQTVQDADQGLEAARAAQVGQWFMGSSACLGRCVRCRGSAALPGAAGRRASAHSLHLPVCLAKLLGMLCAAFPAAGACRGDAGGGGGVAEASGAGDGGGHRSSGGQVLAAAGGRQGAGNGPGGRKACGSVSCCAAAASSAAALWPGALVVVCAPGLPSFSGACCFSPRRLQDATSKNFEGGGSGTGSSVSLSSLVEVLGCVYEQCGFSGDASVTPLQMLSKVEVGCLLGYGGTAAGAVSVQPKLHCMSRHKWRSGVASVQAPCCTQLVSLPAADAAWVAGPASPLPCRHGWRSRCPSWRPACRRALLSRWSGLGRSSGGRQRGLPSWQRSRQST